MSDWPGLDWTCNLCGAAYNSQHAADECLAICREEDRLARRR